MQLRSHPARSNFYECSFGTKAGPCTVWLIWIFVSEAMGFVCAGFEVRDAIALLRMDDLYVECFEIKDVKVRNEELDSALSDLVMSDVQSGQR